MSTILVWALLTVTSANGLRTEKPQMLFPSQQECEKARSAEIKLVQQMQKSTWGASSDTGYYIQSKCEAVNIFVVKQ